MPTEFKDVTGTPRPARDIEAALKFVEAEIVDNPMRMGARNTGPAAMHLMVIRDVLRDALRTSQACASFRGVFTCEHCNMSRAAHNMSDTKEGSDG